MNKIFKVSIILALLTITGNACDLCLKKANAKAASEYKLKLYTNCLKEKKTEACEEEYQAYKKAWNFSATLDAAIGEITHQ